MLLSLDVGFRNMGWVVFHGGKIFACGVIETEKARNKQTRVADDNAWRSAELAKGLQEIIQTYNVRGVIGELPSGGAQNAIAMSQMSMATAVASAVCALLDIPCEWVSPGDLKKALVGKRSASKEEIMIRVRGLYPEADFPMTKGKFEHVADAVGAYHALKNGNLVRLFG